MTTVTYRILPQRTSWTPIHVVLFLIVVSGNAFAGSPVHGSKGAALGTAFSAVADDPSAIVSNPAGLTQVEGTTIYGGAAFVIPSTTFTDASGGKEKTDFQIFYPPHAYGSSDCAGKDLRLGLGIYSPFGVGGRKWDSDGVTRYLSIKSQIATLSINPTIAYRVLPSLSVGSRMESRHPVRKERLRTGVR